MRAAVAELRETLTRRYPDALPLVYRTAPTVATGLDGLDGLLPNGGIPRGRLTVWVPGGGATAVLRHACRSVVRRGERAAWVDGERVVTGEAWPRGVVLVRPVTPESACSCAEELVRSGGFSLVVVSVDKSVLERKAARLGRAIREGGGGFVAVSGATALAHLRVASRIVIAETVWRQNPFGEPAGLDTVALRIEAQALGWGGRTFVRLPVRSRAARLGLDPLVDRRGGRGRVSGKGIPG